MHRGAGGRTVIATLWDALRTCGPSPGAEPTINTADDVRRAIDNVRERCESETPAETAGLRQAPNVDEAIADYDAAVGTLVFDEGLSWAEAELRAGYSMPHGGRPVPARFAKLLDVTMKLLKEKEVETPAARDEPSALWFTSPPSDDSKFIHGPVQGEISKLSEAIGKGKPRALRSKNGNNVWIEKLKDRCFACWFTTEREYNRVKERMDELNATGNS